MNRLREFLSDTLPSIIAYMLIMFVFFAIGTMMFPFTHEVHSGNSVFINGESIVFSDGFIFNGSFTTNENLLPVSPNQTITLNYNEFKFLLLVPFNQYYSLEIEPIYFEDVN